MIETLGVEKGLRQGAALSTTPFNVVLEKVIRNIETNPNGIIFNRTRQCMANADNVFILGLSMRAIEEMVTRIKEAGVSTGLVMKESKTKYVKITRNITNLALDLIMDRQVFEGVQNSRYLGALIIHKIQ